MTPAEQQLLDQIKECARHNDDLMRYACLVAWCRGAGEWPILEVGRALQYALTRPSGDFIRMMEQDQATSLRGRAAALGRTCASLLREFSSWTIVDPDQSDFPFHLAERLYRLCAVVDPA